MVTMAVVGGDASGGAAAVALEGFAAGSGLIGSWGSVTLRPHMVGAAV
jgi:hypothetical protein